MRKFGLIWIVVFLCVGATGGTAHSVKEKYSYLGETIDILIDASLSGPEISQDEFTKAMVASCASLNRLMKDEEFKKILININYSNEVSKQVLGSVQHLAEFLDFERKLLIELGVSARTATQLISNLALVAQQTSRRRSKLNPHKVIEMIGALAELSCNMSRQALEKIKNAERWELILKTGRGVGGVVIIVVDTSTAAQTAGMTAPSYLVGGALLGSALAF